MTTTRTYKELPATSEVPCRTCGGDTIPPQPAWGERDYYCEACATETPAPAK